MVDTVRTQADFLGKLNPNNNHYAKPTSTVLESQLARDLLVSLPSLVGSGIGSSVVVVDGVTYPLTTAGIQAAHDSLPASGGTIVLLENSTIQSDGVTVFLTKPVRLLGNGSTIKAPANDNSYLLMQVGSVMAAAGVSSNLSVNALHGDNQVTVVSTAGFAMGDWVTISDTIGTFANILQLNRVRRVFSATVLELVKPVSKPCLLANTGVVGKFLPLTQHPEVRDLRFDNNGNTNPGLITGWTGPTTTFTGNVALYASSGTLTNAASFAIGDFILIRDGNKVGYGESVGWVAVITNKVGSTITWAGEIPFAASAATAVVQNVGQGGSNAQLHGNIGIRFTGIAWGIVKNVTGLNIAGALFFSDGNWNSSYQDIIPYRCGFPFEGTTSVAAFAIHCLYDNGTNWVNCYADESVSWGVGFDTCFQMTGDIGAINSYSRGVKFNGCYDNVMIAYAHNGKATGVTLSGASCFNQLECKGNGNGEEGLWLDSTANTDNYLRFMGSGNYLVGGGNDTSMTVASLRTIVEVLNEDAKVPLQPGYKSEVWKNVPYAAGNFVASAGNWTVAAGDQSYYRIKLDGYTITVAFAIDTTSVSATPNSLRINLPTNFTWKGGAANRIGAVDNNVEAPAAIANGLAGTTYIGLFISYIGLLGGALNWAISADLTSVRGEITGEVE